MFGVPFLILEPISKRKNRCVKVNVYFTFEAVQKSIRLTKLIMNDNHFCIRTSKIEYVEILSMKDRQAHIRIKVNHNIHPLHPF